MVFKSLVGRFMVFKSLVGRFVVFKSLVGRFMVFKATFNNISVIWWPSVLLMEEIRVPRENHRPVTSH